jgi:DNA-binding response OmpR family regulator
MSRDAGFDRHLVKPFDIAALEAILRAHSDSIARDSGTTRP